VRDKLCVASSLLFVAECESWSAHSGLPYGVLLWGPEFFVILAAEHLRAQTQIGLCPIHAELLWEVLILPGGLLQAGRA